MRGEYLRKILNPYLFRVINIDIPISLENRIFRSLGWRYKIGPLIHRVNSYLVANLEGKWNYDLVWIDKGVFIDPTVVSKLKKYSKTLVHFTPDPAFTYHRSNLFYRAIPFYDYIITTKSFEIDFYKSYGSKNVLFCTQGYDKQIHKPYHSFEEKEGIVFIGHQEKNREEVLTKLLEHKFPLILAGIGWRRFYRMHKNNSNLRYHGEGVFGEKYAQLISSGLISLGFLSKIIPELHTTRTLEIPACNTVLATEKNIETESIFSNDEVIFYDTPHNLTQRLIEIYSNRELLKKISENGFTRVCQNDFDYESILRKLINQITL
jgi:spore maturation protein CgeB